MIVHTGRSSAAPFAVPLLFLMVAVVFGQTPLTSYTRSASATKRIKTAYGSFAVWIDETKWTQTKQSNANNAEELDFVKGKTLVEITTTPTNSFSTDMIRDGFLEHLKTTFASDAKIVSTEQRSVNGRRVLSVQYRATPATPPSVRLYCYFYSGTSGTIQLIGETSESAFDHEAGDIVDFLNGLEISDQELSPASPGVHTDTSSLVGISSTVQTTRTRIGQHQIGETLESWHMLEPGQSVEQPQEIAPHHLGEMFSDWLTLTNFNLDKLCASRKRRDKVLCETLSTLRGRGEGVFDFDNQESGFVWRFSNGRVTDYKHRVWLGQQLGYSDGLWYSDTHSLDSEKRVVRQHGNRQYTYIFLDRRLSQVRIGGPDLLFSEEVGLLTSTYGKPVRSATMPWQNAYGAQWESRVVSWLMPDETQIDAVECTKFAQSGLLDFVTFSSKEAREASREAQSEGANPYKK